MPCREPHPDRPGVFCESPDESPHYGEHYAYDAGDWLNWANPNEPPPKVKGLRKNLSDGKAHLAVKAIRKPARESDPQTSHDAAEPYATDDASAFRAGSLRHRVLIQYLDGDFTALEAARLATGVNNTVQTESARKRVPELEDAGYIEAVGVVHQEGSDRTQYRITREGQSALDRLATTGWSRG